MKDVFIDPLDCYLIKRFLIKNGHNQDSLSIELKCGIDRINTITHNKNYLRPAQIKRLKDLFHETISMTILKGMRISFEQNTLEIDVDDVGKEVDLKQWRKFQVFLREQKKKEKEIIKSYDDEDLSDTIIPTKGMMGPGCRTSRPRKITR